MDFYRPLKFEQDIDGTQIDVLPTDANETEDAALVHAIAVSDKNTLIKQVDLELAFQDGINGLQKLSALTGGAGVSKEYVIAMSIALG